jgi:hypothetical protein
VRAVSCVELTNVTLVAAVPPIEMVAPDAKPVPDTVMAVPPEVGPLSGDTDVAVSAVDVLVYVKAPARAAVCPLGLRTTTSRAPAVPAGVRAVSRVELEKVTLVAAAPPTVTVAPDTKFVPVSVIVVPPDVGPDVGETDVSVGAGVVGVPGTV